MATTPTMPPPAPTMERAAYDTSVLLFQPKYPTPITERNARVLSLAKYAVLEVLRVNHSDDEEREFFLAVGVTGLHPTWGDAMRDIHALADALGLGQLPLPGTEVRQ